LYHKTIHIHKKGELSSNSPNQPYKMFVIYKLTFTSLTLLSDISQ